MGHGNPNQKRVVAALRDRGLRVAVRYNQICVDGREPMTLWEAKVLLRELKAGTAVLPQGDSGAVSHRRLAKNCPECGSTNVYRYRGTRRHKCYRCRHRWEESNGSQNYR